MRVIEQDGSQVSFDYDDLDRLTSAMQTGTYPFTQSYGYDANNNRTSFVNNGTATNATYDAANQIISWGGVSHSYDPYGRASAGRGQHLPLRRCVLGRCRGRLPHGSRLERACATVCGRYPTRCILGHQCMGHTPGNQHVAELKEIVQRIRKREQTIDRGWAACPYANTARSGRDRC